MHRHGTQVHLDSYQGHNLQGSGPREPTLGWVTEASQGTQCMLRGDSSKQRTCLPVPAPWDSILTTYDRYKTDWAQREHLVFKSTQRQKVILDCASISRTPQEINGRVSVPLTNTLVPSPECRRHNAIVQKKLRPPSMGHWSPCKDPITLSPWASILEIWGLGFRYSHRLIFTGVRDLNKCPGPTVSPAVCLLVPGPALLVGVGEATHRNSAQRGA